MSTLELNAMIANFIGYTGIGIFLCAWIHETYTDWKWSRREEEYRRTMEREHEARKLQSRRAFADNMITFPEVSTPHVLNEVKFNQGTRTL